MSEEDETGRVRVSPTQTDEYLDHTSFFDALRLHMQFTEVWSRRPDQASKSEQMRYAQGLQKLTDQLWFTFVELLTSGWLVIEEDAEEEEDTVFINCMSCQLCWASAANTVSAISAQRRRLELKRIRCAYLPELVFRLHTALTLSGETYIPR